MAIERISELPWASFEAQLIQKCATYWFKDHSSPQPPAYSYWSTYKEPDRNADEAYCIQQQILFNATALNDELGDIAAVGDRASDKEVFFWNDLVQHLDPETSKFVFDHEGFENTWQGRHSQTGDVVFKENPSFLGNPYDTEQNQTEQTNLLTSLPKTHAAKSLVEVSEYVGPDHPDAKHSNYVSRKVSMLWFFNVIKAIAKAVRVVPWWKIGVRDKEFVCRHDEAEMEYDEVNNRAKHGRHYFRRSTTPATDGSLKVYGNAQFNGEVSTFHSQARFHDEVTMWDKLSVYGQSFFSKDINGTAMRTRWGDLAEYYSSDKDYEPGTLVRFGGEKEVTVANASANAVVTSNPGLVLNEEMRMRTNGPKHPVGLALAGRVPVKVWGGCAKFDLLVPDPDHPGWARVQAYPSEQPIARALENKMSEDLVLCATNFRI